LDALSLPGPAPHPVSRFRPEQVCINHLLWLPITACKWIRMLLILFGFAGETNRALAPLAGIDPDM
jgi:hypothetical protein